MDKKPRIRIRVKEPRGQQTDPADNTGHGGRENGAAGEQVAPPRANFLRGFSSDSTGRGRENGVNEQVAPAPQSPSFLRPAVPSASFGSETGSANSDDLVDNNNSFQGPTRSAVARLLEHNTHAETADKVTTTF